MELTEDVLVTARSAAMSTWNKVRYALADSSLDLDDFIQQAYLIAWQLDEGPTGGMLYVTLRLDLLDWLRTETKSRSPYVPKGRGAVASIDENYTLYGELVRDPQSEGDFRLVEVHEDLRRVFEKFPGRDADIARAHMEGESLKSIGDRYGFTESRACQIQQSFIRRVHFAWARTDQHERIAHGA